MNGPRSVDAPGAHPERSRWIVYFHGKRGGARELVGISPTWTLAIRASRARSSNGCFAAVMHASEWAVTRR